MVLEYHKDILGEIHSTHTLERVRIVDADFVNPDGSELRLDKDYFEKTKKEKSVLGPINHLQEGKNHVKVWGN